MNLKQACDIVKYKEIINNEDKIVGNLLDYTYFRTERWLKCFRKNKRVKQIYLSRNKEDISKSIELSQDDIYYLLDRHMDIIHNAEHKLAELRGEKIEDKLTKANDPETTRYGEWLIADTNCDEDFMCSVCGTLYSCRFGSPEEDDLRYCPHCGTAMEF